MQFNLYWILRVAVSFLGVLRSAASSHMHLCASCLSVTALCVCLRPQSALRREVVRRREQLGRKQGPDVAQSLSTAPGAWDEAYTLVMAAQQQTVAQLLELINAAKAELAEEVRPSTNLTADVILVANANAREARLLFEQVASWMA